MWTFSNFVFKQQVKDRTCLRALEKVKSHLEKGNEVGDQSLASQDASTTVFQNEDGNDTLTWISFPSLQKYTFFPPLMCLGSGIVEIFSN